MNFKRWFEDTHMALPTDPELNGLSLSASIDPEEDIDPQTGRRHKIRSRKADKLFGFYGNKQPRRK